MEQKLFDDVVRELEISLFVAKDFNEVSMGATMLNVFMIQNSEQFTKEQEAQMDAIFSAYMIKLDRFEDDEEEYD